MFRASEDLERVLANILGGMHNIYCTVLSIH
jgi:hypothetical protein